MRGCHDVIRKYLWMELKLPRYLSIIILCLDFIKALFDYSISVAVRAVSVGGQTRSWTVSSLSAKVQSGVYLWLPYRRPHAWHYLALVS